MLLSGNTNLSVQILLFWQKSFYLSEVNAKLIGFLVAKSQRVSHTSKWHSLQMYSLFLQFTNICSVVSATCINIPILPSSILDFCKQKLWPLLCSHQTTWHVLAIYVCLTCKNKNKNNKEKTKQWNLKRPPSRRGLITPCNGLSLIQLCNISVISYGLGCKAGVQPTTLITLFLSNQSTKGWTRIEMSHNWDGIGMVINQFYPLSWNASHD